MTYGAPRLGPGTFTDAAALARPGLKFALFDKDRLLVMKPGRRGDFPRRLPPRFKFHFIPGRASDAERGWSCSSGLHSFRRLIILPFPVIDQKCVVGRSFPWTRIGGSPDRYLLSHEIDAATGGRDPKPDSTSISPCPCKYLFTGRAAFLACDFGWSGVSGRWRVAEVFPKKLAATMELAVAFRAFVAVAGLVSGLALSPCADATSRRPYHPDRLGQRSKHCRTSGSPFCWHDRLLGKPRVGRR